MNSGVGELAEGAPCPVHPAEAATGTCQRCGTFTCARCFVDAEAQRAGICPRCVAREKGPALERLRALRRRLSRSFAIVSPIAIALTGIALFLASPSAGHIGGPSAVPLLLVSLAIAGTLVFAAVRVRKAEDDRAAWAGVVAEVALVLELVVLGGGLGCLTLGLAVVPLLTARAVRRLSRLRAEAEREAEAVAALGL